MTPAEIRALRIRCRMTQEQFAQRVGVSFTTVNRWEAGLVTPQQANLAVMRALMPSVERYDLDALRDAAREMDRAITQWFPTRDPGVVMDRTRLYYRTQLENAIATMEGLLDAHRGL